MKKIILILALMLIATQSKADCTLETLNDTDCFQCGENCLAHVTYEDEVQPDGSTKSVGTMTLSGQGPMTNWIGSEVITSIPWYAVKNNIQNISIEEGITSIGFNAFYDFFNLQNIELPQSLREIHPGGLENCTSLENLTIPDNVTIDTEALETTGITTLVIPANTTLSPTAFKADNRTPTLIEKLYCAPQMRQACEAAIAYRGEAAEVVEYQQTSDNQYLVDGKYYARLNDIGTPNYIKKRIYTVEEANEVAGKVNRVTIRYK